MLSILQPPQIDLILICVIISESSEEPSDSPVAMETEPPASAQAGAAYSKCSIVLFYEL